uniref:Recombinase n=1 Tax=Bursaphelenchus xylophilus TaxID=6326 RepID=A0A1I7SES4_BURXY
MTFKRALSKDSHSAVFVATPNSCDDLSQKNELATTAIPFEREFFPKQRQKRIHFEESGEIKKDFLQWFAQCSFCRNPELLRRIVAEKGVCENRSWKKVNVQKMRHNDFR